MDKRKMEELKEKLMREMEVIASKGPLTMADITLVDTLAHAVKNLCKVMEEDEGESYGYSGKHHVRGHYSRDSYNSGSYNSGNSGSYAERSYGGGSYHEMKDMLEREYSNARDERERETIRRLMDKM